MNSLRLRAAGKINLFLEILGVRPDGYHDLYMVLQSIDLADFVTLKPANSLSIHCTHPLVPNDSRNLAWKAAELIQKVYGITQGIEIWIDKHIPVASGLAGGSADAAAVLVGLNQLWDLGLTQIQLQELAGQLGSDIPFCVVGGTALGLGRGDELTALALPKPLHLVVAKPKEVQVSTAWAYGTYREKYLPHRLADRANAKEMLAALSAGDVHRIAAALHNDLEAPILPAHPEVAALRERFMDNGAIGAMMSGSGSAVFGLALNRFEAENLFERMQGDGQIEIHLCHTVLGGVTLEDLAS
ncbi:MAG: 4-(cytidine 5'-diphospho)-2-C-methyl-D-erythritol kinase [Anaerolineae bacterium]|nr:4-(cytidine 5'-diphospho)-2-C-methyl-D-erythritol kinase [Gloeobacterales cyanobacterium ES-bin-313]